MANAMMRRVGVGIVGLMVWMSGASGASGAELTYRVGMVGSPVIKGEWGEEAMGRLRGTGFNMVQLNVAWGSRPFGEALNLRDVVGAEGEKVSEEVAKRNAELKRRVKLAKGAGLRTLFHFGSPYMWRDPDTGEVNAGRPVAFGKPYFDTGNPKLVEYEVGLLKEFVREFPEVDDILVYTYDQDAWQASQFSEARYSRGIPLHERLPKYLKQLQEAFVAGREGHRMWWEPWELSAGQIYRILPQVPVENFGLIIHCNIAEAEIARPVDLWYRVVARMCGERGIPVIGEAAFCDMTEETQDWGIPCPRLVDEQYQRMAGVPGIVGIKEYFGTAPGRIDLNYATFAARLNGNREKEVDLVAGLVGRFGENNRGEMMRMLKEFEDAMQVYPWEAAWQFRLTSHASIDHGWAAGYVHGQMADTPSWNSTRRGMFMVTDDVQQHPDLLEDVGLRCEIAAEGFERGSAMAKDLVGKVEGKDEKGYLGRVAKESEGFMRVARSFGLHLRETNVAWLLRGDLEHGPALTPRLVEEMRDLLRRDEENQGGKGRVVGIRKLFEDQPEEFLKTKLLPGKTVLEKGHFTVTTR